MSLRYETFYPTAEQLTDICVICREQFSANELIAAHEGDGRKHPLHLACVKSQEAWRLRCPSCRQPTDPDSLISWQERSIHLIQNLPSQIPPGVRKTIAGTVLFALIGAAASTKEGIVLSNIIDAAQLGARVGGLMQMTFAGLEVAMGIESSVPAQIAVTGIGLATGSWVSLHQGFGTFSAAVLVTGAVREVFKSENEQERA